MLFRKQAQLSLLPKNACVETNIQTNSKAIIVLALCPGRCLMHDEHVENDKTIFFHVTAGNVKFAVNQ